MCLKPIIQGCQTHFHRGPHQPRSCLQKAECNFNSLTVKEQLHLHSPKIQPFEGNHKADEFDTAAVINFCRQSKILQQRATFPCLPVSLSCFTICKMDKIDICGNDYYSYNTYELCPVEHLIIDPFLHLFVNLFVHSLSSYLCVILFILLISQL